MNTNAGNHVTQTVVGGAALTVAAGSYVIIPPPESILEFSIFVVSIAGLPYDFSVRDLIFIITAGIAIYTFIKNRSNKKPEVIKVKDEKPISNKANA